MGSVFENSVFGAFSIAFVCKCVDGRSINVENNLRFQIRTIEKNVCAWGLS